jgi:hypothetical protein
MMARTSTHTVKTMLTFGEHEQKIEVRFRYHPERDATPPSYASGGEPPEGATLEIESITVAGVDVPGWLFDALADDDEFVCRLITEAESDIAADRADHADYLAESRREYAR